jgi:soluble lytic murein transglycosylase
VGVTQRHVTYSRGRSDGVAMRRRRLTVLVTLALIGAGLLLVLPLARRAIQHFTLPLSYASIIRSQAAAKHLDPALIAAVIYAETRFRPRESSTGALGLMQVEPTTAQFLARRSGGYAFNVADLGTPSVNIAYGSYYLRYLLNAYGGNETLALAAYNGGETNVNTWLNKARAAHHSFTVADIPIAQTRAYVSEVTAKQQAYRTHYAHQLGYS